jgi:glyoxylase-like metal-dependent hydrolase (beta-lactamase superfamily II)
VTAEPSVLPTYELFAVRYATVEKRMRENFITPPDPHDGPMPMDYFVWAIRSAERTIVVDTGFGEAAAKARNRTLLRCPGEGLKAIGIDPAAVLDVVLTHLHYDHAGNLDLFPAAVFHVQDAELAYATGRCMCHDALRHAFSVEDVVTMVRRVYDGRARFHDGTVELAPGISLHRVGGHTAGLQVVRVHTARGWVVLASDATHYYANIRRRSPFPIVLNVADMLEAYGIVERLADGPDHIIPGHDPLVRERYPRHGDSDAVALHLPPRGQ